MDDLEAGHDFWTIAGNFYRHDVEPRVQLYVPSEESFPIPLEYIDVIRRADATLDVLLDSRIGDCWNVEGGQKTIGAMDGCRNRSTLLT